MQKALIGRFFTNREDAEKNRLPNETIVCVPDQQLNGRYYIVLKQSVADAIFQ